MSNYIYTDNNNSISIGKFIQGPVGPTGSVGNTGLQGTQGTTGIQGPKGPDNILSGDVAFNDFRNPFYTVYPYRGYTLVGHIIAADLKNLTSVKVIIGGNTNQIPAQCKIKVTDNIGSNNNQIIIADKTFEYTGRGTIQETKIINLNIADNITTWPPGDTILSLWAAIEPSSFLARSKNSSSTLSGLAAISADYGPDRAAIEKQRFLRGYDDSISNTQKTLEQSYGISLRRTDREIAILRKEQELDDRKFDSQYKKELDKVEKENNVNSSVDYIPKDVKISQEHEMLFMERRITIKSNEEIAILEKNEEENIKKALTEDGESVLSQSKKSGKTIKGGLSTDGNSAPILCEQWQQQYCGSSAVQEVLNIMFLQLS